jgi:prepilin-type N-terminal cleavage/methylation domain-containing protein/prepilin-type processing-associated H-X9-DG protein
MKKKFSLIELLIVMAVLLILASILQPSLKSVMNSARTLQCLNNIKGLGSAVSLYQHDNQGNFPTIQHWGPISGGYGNTRFYGGFTKGPKDRPLNTYLNEDPTVSECPADKGDGWLEARVNQDIYDCYDNYGTSYLGQYAGDIFGVKHVFGRIGQPVNLHDLSSLSNKLVLGDWVWHPNRLISMPESRWHSEDSREYNMLFGDGHGELFDFTLNYEKSWLPANPKNRFW